jgi:RHS repeat-associated protein
MESFGAYGQRRGTKWVSAGSLRRHWMWRRPARTTGQQGTGRSSEAGQRSAGSPTSGERATINDTTRKGFTEHEMLDSTDLVQMNGRVFDPVIGRFVSADPYIDCSLETQGHNRYAYVGNPAVTLKDPSGLLSAWGFDGGLAVTSWGLAVGLDADEEIPVIGHISVDPWVQLAGPNFLENWEDMQLQESLVQSLQRMEELWLPQEEERKIGECVGDCVAERMGEAGRFIAEHLPEIMGTGAGVGAAGGLRYTYHELGVAITLSRLWAASHGSIGNAAVGSALGGEAALLAIPVFIFRLLCGHSDQLHRPLRRFWRSVLLTIQHEF